MNSLEDNLTVYKVVEEEQGLSSTELCLKIRKLSHVASQLHFQGESEQQVICLELLT